MTACRSSARAVLPRQQQRMPGRHVSGAVVVDQRHQVRVQRQVAVLAELADRDVQPGCGADLHDGVGGQAGELADPQPGAQQHLDGDPDQQPWLGLRGPEQLRGGGVVECLGQRVVLAGQVAGEHRHPCRCFLPAPLVDPDEEHSQRAEPVRQCGARDPGLVLSGSFRQPGLVVLDVSSGDLIDAGDLGRDLDQEAGEGAQRAVGVGHAARSQHAADLRQVAAHRGHDAAAPPARAVPSVGSAASPLRPRTGAAVTGHRRRVELRVEDLGCRAVLVGQPVVGQVQVDPGGLDRGVPGLGLHRLECHPGLPQPGQTGVPQLVAGRVRQPGATSGTGEHLVQPAHRQRLTAGGPFSTTNTRSALVSAGRSVSR